MYTTSYIYDKDNKLTDINYGDNKITCTYGDDLERLKKKSISSDGGATSIYDVTYSYESGKVTNSTTNRISEISNNGATLQYTYDSFGNIKTVTDSNNKIIQYFYNYLNELVRENNKVLDKTIIYSYDKGGNILSKREYEYTTAETPATLVKEYTYQYDDVWKDKLTSFDGKGITYDAIGNPLTYDNYAYTWQKGRQLATMKHNDNGIDISYKYNASGIRTEKKVVENSQTVTTKYLFEGDKVVYESNGTDNIYYTYSLGAKLVSMNLNDIEYFYIRNTQGDIIALIDDKGDEVVKYTYDSWGKLISIKDKDDIDVTNDKTHVGYKNPYRYRGYRYDTETQLYYLDSRYYNPEWGRFINSDNLGGKIGDLLSHNVFAYCKNNPVNMSDPSGHWPKWAKWAVVAVAVVAVVAVAIVAPEVIPAIATAVSNAYYSLGAAATVASWRVSKAVKPVVQRATGAFSSGATGVGNGLGVLKDKAINVTKKGLDIVKKHLSTNNFAEFPENQAMVSRLETAVSNGTKITGADASFYMHELAESTMMKNGMAYNLAHAAALEKYGVSPFSVYHQDIIKIMPEIFNSNWRKFWEGN